MSEYEVISTKLEDTQLFSERLASSLQPGDVITLAGDLGAGRTAFTKGLAVGLGIQRNVNSPTFTIIKEYQGNNMPLYHMDVYRLEDSYEDLGFEEYFNGNGVTVVEWAHLIEEQLPVERLNIFIHHQGNDSRKIVVKPVGERYEQLCKEIFS